MHGLFSRQESCFIRRLLRREEELRKKKRRAQARRTDLDLAKSGEMNSVPHVHCLREGQLMRQTATSSNPLRIQLIRNLRWIRINPILPIPEIKNMKFEIPGMGRWGGRRKMRSHLFRTWVKPRVAPRHRSSHRGAPGTKSVTTAPTPRSGDKGEPLELLRPLANQLVGEVSCVRSFASFSGLRECTLLSLKIFAVFA